jgi:hypothetical protein
LIFETRSNHSPPPAYFATQIGGNSQNGTALLYF